MTPEPVRKFIADRMSIAVKGLVEDEENATRKTEEFWRAFSDFGHEFITGSFSMVVNNDNGHIIVIYRP